MNQLINLWETTSIANKFTSIMLTFVMVVLILLGAVVYQSRKASQWQLTDDRMYSQLDDLLKILDVTLQGKSISQEQVQAEAERLLRESGDLYIDSLLPYLNLSYSPLEVAGSLSESDLEYIESVVGSKQYYENGFPVMIDDGGILLIHPFENGADISGTDIFSQMKLNSTGMLAYSFQKDSMEVNNYLLYYTYHEPSGVYAAIAIDRYEVIGRSLMKVVRLVFIGILVGIVLMTLIIRSLMGIITKPIAEASGILEKLSLGITQKEHVTTRKDEIGYMYELINKLITGLRKTGEFAIEIGRNNFSYPFEPMSKDDALGNALLDMRNSLQKAEEDEKLRRIEDEKRKWTNEGLARFGEIVRVNNDNMEAFSFNVIKNLVKYVKAVQGGLFILEEDHQGEKFLNMTACYAFDRKKYMTKKILMGEGITGACALEKKTIYMKKLPEDYIFITSGLGDAPPDYLLVIPLLLNDEVHGVIELASFYDFQPHEVEFIEKIGETIAATISGVRTSMQTAELLEQSRQQSEEMRAQEEEMRQNLEEMQSTQEELQRRTEDMKRIQEDLSKEGSLLHALLSSSEDCIYFKDHESRFLRVSHSLLKLLGLNDHTQIVGLSDFDFAPHDIAKPKYDAEMEIIQTGKILKIEEQDIGKDGSERYVSTVKMPLRDAQGNIVGTLGVSRDITEFRQSILRIQQTEKELRIKAAAVKKLEVQLRGMAKNEK